MKIEEARSSAVTSEKLAVGDVIFDLKSHRLAGKGSELHIPGKRYDLLMLFVELREDTVTKGMFFNRLYAGEKKPEEGMFKVLVCHLRRALKKVSDSIVIETVHGVGYRLSVREVKA